MGQGLPASASCMLGTQFMCILSNIMYIPILETCELKLGNWRGIAGKESYSQKVTEIGPLEQLLLLFFIH